MSVLKLIILASASLFCTCNAGELLQDLQDSVETKNHELFIQTVRRCKELKIIILDNGQTPLTLAIKELNFRKSIIGTEKNKENLDQKKLGFFIKILPYMQDFLDMKNAEGQLPLELALKLENFDFAVHLVRQGANICLVSNCGLLEKRIGDNSFISKIINEYISYFIVFMNSLSTGKSIERFHKFSLENIVSIYFAKCRLNDQDQKASLLEIVNTGESKIQPRLQAIQGGKKKKDFSRRFLPKALLKFFDLFSQEKELAQDGCIQDAKLLELFGNGLGSNLNSKIDKCFGENLKNLGDNSCEFNKKELVSACFDRIYHKIENARKNTDQVFFDNLVSKKNKSKFIDIKVSCKQ